jgi:hypothetical protein
MYTGREKGGLSSPRGNPLSFRHQFPLLNTYIPYSTTLFKESLDIPIIYTMTAPKQHKQRYYYIFWSIATLAVVCGQIYVASGYRSLASALRLSLVP